MKKWMFLLLCLSVHGLYADTATEALQKKLNALTSMRANFTQIVTAGKRKVSEGHGNMALARPGRFRWQTQSPVEQLVIADGSSLWVYDVDLEQVTVKAQDNSLTGTPALFLSRGNDVVSRDFNVIFLGPKEEQATKPETMQSYDLHAKSSKENYQHIILKFRGEALSGIEFFDQLGQHTVIQLSQIKVNPKLAESLFQFVPPKGVDVVRQ